ncbi:serine/threonine-protein kinase [Micromonospora sp. WMMD734]|uniref:non-specific serine/threonine protein kinase n=1 Tax=Micromonospora humidisoli TaxID=2807622 RepID=A0ABS2JDJ2_9ACTN|nr:serine/threonine-protein kinase [Micromonospora humidisoli]MBM7084600.1 serine/threonine protein kinase [Micromonospora humidisoli]
MTGDWRLSGYTPVRQLGTGASGRVLLATHDATGTPVAIRYLTPSLGDDPAFRLAFREQARLLVDVDDPHVCRLFEYAESHSAAAIVAELVNGVTLRHLLRAHGPVPPEAALCVLKGSLAGLAAAHARGVVHGDHRPENVLVTPDGRCKLTDLAIVLPTAIGRRLAPEQWTGAPAEPAGDIYAATATFVECLTGRPPYDGRDQATLRAQHSAAPIPDVPTPAPVHDLLRHGLAWCPADRTQPAEIFLAELEHTAARSYGGEWEERGRRQLAQRVALLAASLPLPDGGPGAGDPVDAPDAGPDPTRRGGPRSVLVGVGLTATLLVGVVALGVAAGRSGPLTLADGTAGPGATAAATRSPAPLAAAPAITVVPAEPRPTPTPAASTTGASPSTAPTRSAAATTTRVRTPSPAPPTTPNVPLLPPDVSPPTVSTPDVSPITVAPQGCPDAVTATTVTATVVDDRAAGDLLRVVFRYTLDGVTRTVGMDQTAPDVFQGALGDLPTPPALTRIPVQVVAVDDAGNASAPTGAVVVSLLPACTSS